MSDPDLELVLTEGLLEELFRRFDYGVFIGMQLREEKTGRESLMRAWKGNSHTCLGLCDDVQSYIRDNYRKAETGK